MPLTKLYGVAHSCTLKCPNCQYAYTYEVHSFTVRCVNCDRRFAIPLEKLAGKDTFKTQKMRGMLMLNHLDINTGLMWIPKAEPLPIYGVLTGDPDEKSAKAAAGNYFARPCPLTPRHGFVESRVVSDADQLLALWKESREADPESEVMLTPYMSPHWNMIITPTLVTYGLGHDGATSGKNTLNFPLMPGMNIMHKTLFADEEHAQATAEFLKLAGIGPDDDPYVEVVGLNHIDAHPTITQLRAGPKVGNIKRDFIPTKTFVEEILTPESDDLLAWEKLILSKKGVAGVVVNRPGGSPIDHFSVHARCAGIPVVTTRVVELGETLEAIESVPPDPMAVLEGLAVGAKYDIPATSKSEYGANIVRERLINLSLIALHNSGAFEGKDGFWIGFGAAILLRFGVSALKGESRHLQGAKSISRSSVYDKCLKYSFNRLRAMTPALIHILRYGRYSSSSVGGVKWALCGAACAKLFDAAGNLAKNPTTDSVNDLVMAYNTAVNQAHNGGWWLNKFTSQNAFYYADRNALGYLTQILPVIKPITDYRVMFSDEERARLITKMAKWRPTGKARQPKVLTAALDVVGNSTFSVTVTDQLLKNQAGCIPLPAESVITCLKSMGTFVLGVEDHCYKMDFIDNTGKRSTVWKDTPLEGSAFTK